MDDYTSMVRTLLKPISLELRRVILLKLTAINDDMIAKSREIDLNDLLDDIEEKPDVLDQKLARVAELQRKIIERRRESQKKWSSICNHKYS